MQRPAANCPAHLRACFRRTKTADQTSSQGRDSSTLFSHIIRMLYISSIILAVFPVLLPSSSSNAPSASDNSISAMSSRSPERRKDSTFEQEAVYFWRTHTMEACGTCRTCCMQADTTTESLHHVLIERLSGLVLSISAWAVIKRRTLAGCMSQMHPPSSRHTPRATWSDSSDMPPQSYPPIQCRNRFAKSPCQVGPLEEA